MKHQVLQTATKIKLRELNAHEQRLRSHYAALLAAANHAEAPMRVQLETLYAGVKDLQVVQTPLHPGLDHMGALADFAKSDVWTTAQAVAQHRSSLLKEIDQRQSLWRHNKLLGALLHESLAEELAPVDAEWEAVGDATSSGVGELTVAETQAQLEQYFFAPAPGVTEEAVFDYLESTWARVRDALSCVRAELSEFSESFRLRAKVSSDDVVKAATLLLRDAATLADDVADFLRDVQGNTTTQQELADVLTIELSNLTEFSWPADGVPVQFKRGISGRYRCHLQEDAVSLLLFQHVGMVWGTTIRGEMATLLQALEPTARPARGSVDATRKELRDVFTLAALDATNGGYDEVSGQRKSGFAGASKLDLLRMLSAEAQYQTAFSPEGKPKSLTAVTTDLAFFGPSVSHATVLGCLRFFGVDETTRYLYPRGLSVGRAMTMFLSEMLLFVMDFSVRSTTGIHLFRRHDDIIFFDADGDKAAMAWRSMESWAAVAGLSFNVEKSGSVVLSSALTGVHAAPAPMPSTPIRWGLLELQSDANVRILDDKVDAFALELRDRLAVAPSVFRWINVYNKYMVFFVRNFGSVSPIFGLTHADAVAETLRRVHHKIFPNGDVLAALRARIAQRHAALLGETLPAAWAQWPLKLGGLGLHNPFLVVWSLRRALLDHLASYHTRAHEPWPKERSQWLWRAAFSTQAMQLRERYDIFEETVELDGLEAAFATVDLLDLHQFTTLPGHETKFDAKYRVRSLSEVLERASAEVMMCLKNEYAACLSQVTETSPDSGAWWSTSTGSAVSDQLSTANKEQPYWYWLAQLYSDQFSAEFGTVAFFSRELLPSQLIETIEKTAVSW
ncbi:hypothetical protein SDRG_03935 [Saprolegnia diclina VS20]|uniref:Reverse transcriptase domain-containing protein n=1 Tax=Saprolegnia diclina (strain VS20) TaxID=1156394 RepID=T0S8N2_SAPDV|nr:hypothetical protein SDRG_03935 [Saprolegnia diclina VS20]EQC38982.1 hypothetical protein SDRG_03935 [Saprolegnia diclina VS20]|eukprot:XP_008607806.1 hypothetical protein SDRG_03935 [Saprolegnia diclina VS20]